MAAKVPQQQQQKEDKRWTPILSPLKEGSSARNGITRKKGSPGGLGSDFFPGSTAANWRMAAGGSLLGG